MDGRNENLPVENLLDASANEDKEPEFEADDNTAISESETSSISIAGSLQQALANVQNDFCKSIAPVLKQQAVLNSINAQARITSMVAPLLEQQKLISAISNPLRELQAEMAFKSMELISPAINTYYQGLAESLAASIKPIIDSYKPLMNDAIKRLVSSYEFNLARQIQLPIQRLLETIDFSPIYSVFEQLKGFDFSKYRTRFNKIIIAETYDAKWFPHALCLDDRDMVSDFWEILETTRKSKNRIKRIDQLIFSRYNKDRIESIKKTWRHKNVSSHKIKMMHQAVQAFHRKEYAITVVMLSTLWEGTIYDKANDLRGKTGKRTKEDFNKLIFQTDYDELFASFFDEYIMYDCRSVNDVIDDVPGRNSSAHSWYSKYPSKKAGLNAIIFTDFLINLEQLEE